ncbi:MAG: HEAT repeat domain-containing protein [Flammeovirgaceae bacterium]|jgi:quinoprotein glucose dehydrogenase|nr:HEAT repeat domain-containing protein [Flammeovirgaceae bacterium]|tara:strand:- start:9987 stop:13373 length:3387 start_codon:yes stop_codon:yes gene_type:complete
MRHFTSCWILICLILLNACQVAEDRETIKVIREDATKSFAKAKELKENTAIQLAEGLEISLWATDSLAPDPIAMSIDNFGSIYLTRTNRQKHSEFDIRGHEDWMTRSIALKTVEERRAYLKEIFATEKSTENSWLLDLNNDSLHDWKDLAVERDEVWKLEDTNDDGMADIATRVLNDFHEEITDVAGALLVRDHDMFVGIGPDMWRLEDKDSDGYFETKESINTGFAIHIGFSGHGMSGAIEGPDGKIYWGIGDIGANLTDKEGKQYVYPNQGVLVRSNPDGSDFEVFAAGLRNTHEFAFDVYGNIIGQDNDGDHEGESERLVHIVEGSDAGWRSNWQYGKYTDPKNNGYNVWMDEVLYKPRWEGQAAYIIPPIMNYHNGPTGFTYNPGTGLGKKWQNHFFVSEFVGNPSRSHIWGFTLKPKGVSFEMDHETDVLSGLLPTGIRFGADGALYLADWVNGWDTKNYGRVWKIDVSGDENDLLEERIQTKKLMQLDYQNESDQRLLELLKYQDMRIRQKAQFELVVRGKIALLKEASLQTQHQLMRVHAIWGIGQMAAKDVSLTTHLVDLLSDDDPEIVAQAAKIIGDVRFTEASEQLLNLLNHQSQRVQFYGAQALGRIQEKKAVTPLLKLLADNNDQDVYMRHVAVLALSRIGAQKPILALVDNPNKSLRLAAVLILRKWSHPNLKYFLNDADEYIVTEAARAINDDWSVEENLSDLAALLSRQDLQSAPLLRRAIGAASRVGGDQELDLLVQFANNTKVASHLRIEAISAIEHWASPSVLDRVDGRFRGPQVRNLNTLQEKSLMLLTNLKTELDPEVQVAMIEMFATTKVGASADVMDDLLNKSKDPRVRAAAITSMSTLGSDNILSGISLAMRDSEVIVRSSAIGLLDQVALDNRQLQEVVHPIFAKGTIREQQELLKVLGKMDAQIINDILGELIINMSDGQLNSALHLDLYESVISSKSEDLIAKIKPLISEGETVEDFKETLYGGNMRNGINYYYESSAGQCVRCHGSRDEPGTVGPILANIGNIFTREQLLEALIEPTKRLSPGYGSVSLTLKGGQVVSGILLEEDMDELVLRTSAAEPIKIALDRVETRTNLPSSMPAMGGIMTKREIRDVIEFLANRKTK